MKNLIIILGVFLFSLFNCSNASHIHSANFEWTEIGKDTFRIIVNVYRDCNGTAFTPTSITVSNSKCKNKNINLKRVSHEDITPVCDEQCTKCDSKGCSFKYGIEKHVCEAIFVASNYIKNGCCIATISFSINNRSTAITTGAAQESLFIQGIIDFCNPTNIQWKKEHKGIIGLGKDIREDIGLKSANPQDSIVYSFTEPMQDANTKCTYNTPYSYTKPIYYLGFPRNGLTTPKGIQVDSNTGILTFRPMKTEVTVMAVRAEIFRKGVKIGETVRDMQFTVIKLSNNSAPILSGLVNPKDSTGVYQYSRIICSNKTAVFNVLTADKDRDDTVRIQFAGGIGDSFKVVNPKDKRENGEWFWTPDSKAVGKEFQDFFIEAKDDACPLPLSTVQSYKVKVINGLPKNLAIKDEQIDLCGRYKFSLVDTTRLDYESITWFLNDTVKIDTGKTVVYEFSNVGSHKISVDVVKCDSSTISKVIDVKYTNALKIDLNDTSACADDNITLNPVITGNKGTIKYTWWVSKGLNYGGPLNDSLINIDLSKAMKGISSIIKLEINDTAGCFTNKEINLTSLELNNIALEQEHTICEGNLDTLKLKTLNGEGVWTGAGVSNNMVIPKNLSLTNHWLDFRLKNDTACLVDRMLIRHEELPEVNILTDEFKTCVGANIKYLSAKPEKGIWGGNGIFYNAQDVAQFYADSAGSGNHELIYKFTTWNGCSNSDTVSTFVYDYIPKVKITDSVSVCDDEIEVELESSHNGGEWISNGSFSSSNPLLLDVRKLSIGKTLIMYEYIDSNECRFIDTSLVTINATPKASYSIVKPNIKKGDTLKIINSTSDSGKYKFKWQIGTPAFITATTPNFTEPIDTVGVFDLHLLTINRSTNCEESLKNKNAINILPNSISEVEKSYDIFPNPTHSFIHLKNENLNGKKYYLYNLNGTLIKEGHISESRLSIKEFDTGCYILEIQSNSNLLRYQIVKQ